MADLSQHRPAFRKPEHAGRAMYDTPEEAFDELLRRIMVLGQAGYIYEGLAIRMAADSAVTIQETATTDPRFQNHKGYAAQVDVFESDGGFHVSVDDTVETAALRAEIGSRTVRLQPLWGPEFRKVERETFLKGVQLAGFVARQAEMGVALSDKDLDGIVAFPDVGGKPGLDVLREMVEARKSRMAREEK